MKATTIILKNEKQLDIKSAIKTTRKAIQKSFRGKKTQLIVPRVIHIAKVIGILPLEPILTALGALGHWLLAVQKQLQENARHNKTMEAIAMEKGLYLKPYKKGYGKTATQKTAY